MIEERFKNEDGEDVVVRVERNKGLVHLNIESPQGERDWVITRKEARHLYCALHILEGRVNAEH